MCTIIAGVLSNSSTNVCLSPSFFLYYFFILRPPSSFLKVVSPILTINYGPSIWSLQAFDETSQEYVGFLNIRFNGLLLASRKCRKKSSY